MAELSAAAITAIVVGAAGAVAGTTATVMSVNAQKKANKAQRRITAAQRVREQMERQAEARERYRALRKERAAVVQNTEYLGASDSTSAQSAVGGIQSAYNIGQGFANTTGAIADRINILTDKYQKYNYRAQKWGSWADVGFSIGSVGLQAAPLLNKGSKGGGLDGSGGGDLGGGFGGSGGGN